MSKSANDASIYKVFTWLLLAALIGVYALYNWYQGKLGADLAGERKEVAAAAHRLSEAQVRIQTLTQAEQGLKAQLDALKSAAATEAEEAAAALDVANSQVQDLQAKLDAAGSEIEASASKIQALASRHKDAQQKTESLAGKLQVAGKTEADLKAKLAGGLARIEKLEADLAAREKALSEADAVAESKVKAVQDELGKRITAYRTQLEGSEPERAAHFAGLEEKLASARAERDAQVEQAAREADAAARALAEAKESNAGLQKQIAAMNADIESLRSTGAAHKQNLTKANGEIKARDAKLDRMRQDAEAAAKALAGAKAAQAKAAEQITALKSELVRARGTGEKLKAQLDETAAALSESKAQLDAAVKRAKQENQALAQRIASLEPALKQAKAEILSTREAGEAQLKALAALHDRLSALGGTKTEHGVLLSIGDEVLRFPSGLATLPGDELPSLDRIAALLADYPSFTARIEGHTDSAGPDEINLTLSEARADAVRNALIERGVAEDRLVSEGVGEARPVADNATAAGKRKNRRVEIYILQGNGE